MSLKWIVPVVLVLVAVTAWTMGQESQQPADELVDQLGASGGLLVVAAQHRALVLHVLTQRAASVPAENADTVAAILGESEHQLDACEAALAVHQQVWQYKVCASAVQRQGLASLNGLQATAGSA